MEKESEILRVFKIKKEKDKNKNVYLRISLTKKPKGKMLAIGRYQTNIFDSADTGALFESLLLEMGDEDEKVYKRDEEAPEFYGNVGKVAVKPHYRFSFDNKGKPVLEEDRIIRFVRFVALEGDTLQNQEIAYLARVPEEAWIKDDDEDDDE